MSEACLSGTHLSGAQLSGISGAATVKKVGGKITLQLDNVTYEKSPSRDLCAFGFKLAQAKLSSRKEKALRMAFYGERC